MLTFLLRIILNAILLFLAATIVPDISFPGPTEMAPLTTVWIYVRAGVAMALVNTLITPLLKVLLFPLVLITFGAASVLLNVIALALLALLLPHLTISSLLGLVYGTLVLGIGNLVVNWINS